MRHFIKSSIALLTICLLMSGCYNPDLESTWARGTQLRLGVGTLKTVDQISFTLNGTTRIIRPEPGKMMAALPVQIVNDRTGKALLFVDERSAVLRDVNSRSYSPIDPFSRSVETSEPADTEETFTPFLWGNFSLEQNFEVGGWLIFEVPPDRDWLEIEWRQGDLIIARF